MRRRRRRDVEGLLEGTVGGAGRVVMLADLEEMR